MTDFMMPMMSPPEFSIPKEFDMHFKGINVGKPVNATLQYKVVRKTEHDVTIEIDLLFTNKSRRKL